VLDIRRPGSTGGGDRAGGGNSEEGKFSEKDPDDLTPVTERTDYPPLLDLAVPAVILVSSAAYAWSVRGIPNPEGNLLFLRPLFVAIWAFLLIVLIKDLIPSLRMHGAWRQAVANRAAKPWRERFAPGTEAGAGLVVAATFAFSLHGPGDGPIPYVVSAFLYLVVAGYLIGDRTPVRLLTQAAILSTGLYFIMGFVLGVRL
jgi:hypothetical protein